MNKIGMIIGDRYELIEKIGTGGMADVYKAKCHKLNRFVAVKILKQEFNENKDFVSKFRVEAQATAGLMHTNIVTVYDVGEDDDIYYIVMELVEGITLKRYIEKKVRLTVKESISIAIQISAGIEAAHKSHIIHRDIKPQNIIISKEGKVKVTDFGIAKAATSNTVTSNVMGSVHYTSPEQARGGFSDEKSDIYSLGITMYEMITGRVPFNGETTVAIAIKHIQEKMASPREIVSEIPVSFEQIILKCAEKSADKRYQSMAEVIEDLKKSLLYPDEDFVKRAVVKDDGKTRMITKEEQIQIRSKADTYKGSARTNDRPKVIRAEQPVIANQSNNRKQSSTSKNAERPRPATPKKKVSNKAKEKERIMIIITAIVAIVVLGFLVYVILDINGAFEKEPIIKVPDYEDDNDSDSDGDEDNFKKIKVPVLVNYSEAEARTKLDKHGLKIEKEYENSETIKKGDVIKSTPEAGTSVKAGDIIVVTISSGPVNTDVEMPNLLGKSEADACALLEDKGLSCVISHNNDTSLYPLGSVNYQSYSEGTKVPKGTSIRIQVSDGAGSLYEYKVDILAPFDYNSGEATVVLRASTGEELFRTTTTTFPVAINLSGITQSPKGEITVYYTVPVEQPVTDANGNPTMDIVDVEQTEVYPISFKLMD